MKNFLWICFIVLLADSCKEDRLQSEIDDEIIQNYLMETHLDTIAIKHSSGLYYTIDRKGTGEFIGSRKQVKAYYKGYYTDSVVFDQSGGQPFLFTLSGMIYGWQVGIPLFDKGSKGKLFIPSGLSYSDNKVRIFEVEILDFN